ncbi:MAG: hypothetical protein N4A59_12200 [Marinifilum sp.]|jgi:hypothetical protein|nr:hypothetical protein [Marinifilum sp.]
MQQNRFKVINESKFERLSKKELQASKGGLCFSCKRRDRKVELGLRVRIWAHGTL